jgi:RNA polymerase sigma-70 factor (ECF subfamily)
VGERLTDDDLRSFYDRHYPSIVGAVALVSGSRAAAEDCVHEALARAWERREAPDRVDRWVVTVALNLARNRWRRVRREVPLGALGDGDRPGTDAPDESLDLRRALAALPRRQREAVVLHYLLDLPVAEVAAVLGLTPGGVKHALFRGRRSLSGAMAVEEEVG